MERDEVKCRHARVYCQELGLAQLRPHPQLKLYFFSFQEIRVPFVKVLFEPFNYPLALHFFDYLSD